MLADDGLLKRSEPRRHFARGVHPVWPFRRWRLAYAHGRSI